MKVFGLLMILTACSFSGFVVSEKYLSVLKEITRVKELLSRIVSGIKRENLTLSEIFEDISRNSDKETKEFISALSMNDFKNIETYIEKSCFCKNRTVISIISKTFFVLGRYSAAEQIYEIEKNIDSLELFYEKSEKEILSKAKLSRSLGIIIGFLIVILLI